MYLAGHEADQCFSPHSNLCAAIKWPCWKILGRNFAVTCGRQLARAISVCLCATQSNDQLTVPLLPAALVNTWFRE